MKEQDSMDSTAGENLGEAISKSGDLIDDLLAGKDGEGKGTRDCRETEYSGSCVFMSNAAFEFIEDYSRTDTSREIGGFLLGHYSGDQDDFKVWIEAAVEAAYVETSKAGLRFTHRTWEFLAETREQNFPDCRVVGWFHTHPGLGTFISKHDLFIHDTFFESFWKVSYVIDPLSEEHAFYGWNKYGNLAPISFKVEGEPLYIALTREEKRERRLGRAMKEKKMPRFLGIGKTAAVFAGILFVLFFLNNYFVLHPLYEKINELESLVGSKEETIEALQMENEALVNLLPREDESGIPESGSETAGEQKPVINREDVPYETYTVAEGDTLWNISARLLGDGNRYQELADFNDLGDSGLKPGMKLKIPK